MCYQVRAATQPRRTVSTNNQFEQDTFDIFGIRELCVPAFKFPGTCGDGDVNNAGEECDPPGPTRRARRAPADPTCTCEPPRCGDGVVNQQNEECDGSDDDQCPGFCQQDCTCNPTPPVCSGPVSMERCTCTNGTSFCDMPCAGGLTCADARQGCVDFCNAEGGGPGDCATATCLDCDTDEPCAAEAQCVNSPAPCPLGTDCCPGAVCNPNNSECETCDIPFDDCNDVGSDGCEVNINSDPNNCGFCNNICPPTQACSFGVCRVGCARDDWVRASRSIRVRRGRARFPGSGSISDASSVGARPVIASISRERGAPTRVALRGRPRSWVTPRCHAARGARHGDGRSRPPVVRSRTVRARGPGACRRARARGRGGGPHARRARARPSDGRARRSRRPHCAARGSPSALPSHGRRTGGRHGLGDVGNFRLRRCLRLVPDRPRRDAQTRKRQVAGDRPRSERREEGRSGGHPHGRSAPVTAPQRPGRRGSRASGSAIPAAPSLEARCRSPGTRSACRRRRRSRSRARTSGWAGGAGRRPSPDGSLT